MATVFSNVTFERGMEAISSRLRLVDVRMDWVVSLISCGVRSHVMGGTTSSLFELEALVARARSTLVGSQVPQMDPKSNEPFLLLSLLL